jgi:poly-gamma-glutamate biosynthesis protein PgsC/CapC
LYLHQPIQVVITLLVAIIVWGIIQGLGKIIFLYGKRRIVLALILGFFFGYITRNFLYVNEDFGSLAVIGNIIPGLIANWMDRQGVTRTISVIILTSVLVKLIIMLLFGGQLFE